MHWCIYVYENKKILLNKTHVQLKRHQCEYIAVVLLETSPHLVSIVNVNTVGNEGANLVRIAGVACFTKVFATFVELVDGHDVLLAS